MLPGPRRSEEERLDVSVLRHSRGWGMLRRPRGSPEEGSEAWYDPKVAINRKAWRRERPTTKPETKVRCEQRHPMLQCGDEERKGEGGSAKLKIKTKAPPR